jgi:hypothetical protein
MIWEECGRGHVRTEARPTDLLSETGNPQDILDISVISTRSDG